jgi:glycosyltransferase involved in cell wall biosynthesis
MNNTGKIILSILIPSTPERSDMLAGMYQVVYSQIIQLWRLHPMLGDVEILIDDSKRFLDGGLSIGKKRQSLVERAQGKYLCFLDDDEDIAPNYVETLLRLCQYDADIVTFRNLTKTDHYWTIVDMRLDYQHNDQANPNYITRRRPWHICPVKSEHAKLYEFEDSNYGEDWTWFEKVLKHCATESHTDAVLHCYNHSSKTSEADRITNQKINEMGRAQIGLPPDYSSDLYKK